MTNCSPIMSRRTIESQAIADFAMIIATCPAPPKSRVANSIKCDNDDAALLVGRNQVRLVAHIQVILKFSQSARSIKYYKMKMLTTNSSNRRTTSAESYQFPSQSSFWLCSISVTRWIPSFLWAKNKSNKRTVSENHFLNNIQKAASTLVPSPHSLCWWLELRAKS